MAPDDFLAELSRKLAEAAKKPNTLNYKPNSEVHEAFHKSQKVGRILKGGNRSGKSVAGAVEGINRSTGRHPYLQTHDVPTRGRIVTVDRDSGLKQIILPLLKQWIPPSERINGSWEDSWKNADKVFTFANGSTIEIKTHQQEIDSFAGIPLHWIWFDEECPQAIFNECRLRLIDYNGVWWMTMTPVEGQDWIFDRFLAEEQKNVDVFEVNIKDNPHLNKEALRLLNEDLSDEEKEVREKGSFVPKGGRIFTHFNLNKHVISGGRPVPRNWDIYVSIDHGFNSPTAILWHAVSPEGKVVTFREHYRARMLISKHVDRINEINKEIGRVPRMYTGDPSMSQRNGLTGTSALDEYRRYGIPLVPARKDVAGRNNKMNEYFEHDMWTITRDCPMAIKEFNGYSFAVYESPKIADRNNRREEPKKKNDHCPDSAGYFFMWMPYINTQALPEPKKRSLTETHPQDFPWEVDKDLMGGLDVTYDLSFGEIP